MLAPDHGPERLSLAAGLSREYLLHHRVCPTGVDATTGALVVAAAPGAWLEDALDDLQLAYRVSATVVTEVPAEALERAIERLATRAERSIELARVGGTGEDEAVTADVRDLANQPPVVRYVNLLVKDAYDLGASDIHL